MDHKRSYSLEHELSLAPLLAVVAGLLAWSVLQQLQLGLWDDVTHLIDLSGRLLDGERPYVDFLEANPPASILIYVPPTELAHLLGLPADLMTQVLVFIGAGVSIVFCIRLAKESGTAQELGQAGLLATVAALFVLPACAFAQRDHIALIAALPMLVLMGIRASGLKVGILPATIAGLGGGLMVVIRPHYAVAIGLAALYVAWRRGLGSAALFSEFYAAGLVGVAYLLIVIVFFPSFLSDAMPMVLAIYASAKMDPQDLILRKPTGLIWATLAALALVYRKQFAGSPFAVVAALFSVGAFWSYVFQGKGFPYHGYVALASAFIAVALSLPKPPSAKSLAPIATAIGFLIVVVAESPSGIWVTLVLATILACALVALAVSFLPEQIALKHVRWSIVSCGVLFVAFGQAMAWHQSMWIKDPPFLAEARKLGHPRIALVSPNGNFVEFLADRIGQRFPQHASMSEINDVDYVLHRQNADQATRQKLEAYRREVQDLLLEDIAQGKPDAIIVEVEWAKAHLAQQTLQTVLRDYRLVSTIGGDIAASDPVPLPLLQFYVREPRGN